MEHPSWNDLLWSVPVWNAELVDCSYMLLGMIAKVMRTCTKARTAPMPMPSVIVFLTATTVNGVAINAVLPFPSAMRRSAPAARASSWITFWFDGRSFSGHTA